jgi:hypothetical protein
MRYELSDYEWTAIKRAAFLVARRIVGKYPLAPETIG